MDMCWLGILMLVGLVVLIGSLFNKGEPPDDDGVPPWMADY